MTGYKINNKNQLYFFTLAMNNPNIKKTIQFIAASKIKYLVINVMNKYETCTLKTIKHC